MMKTGHPKIKQIEEEKALNQNSLSKNDSNIISNPIQKSVQQSPYGIITASSSVSKESGFIKSLKQRLRLRNNIKIKKNLGGMGQQALLEELKASIQSQKRLSRAQNISPQKDNQNDQSLVRIESDTKLQEAIIIPTTTSQDDSPLHNVQEAVNEFQQLHPPLPHIQNAINRKSRQEAFKNIYSDIDSLQGHSVKVSNHHHSHQMSKKMHHIPFHSFDNNESEDDDLRIQPLFDDNMVDNKLTHSQHSSRNHGQTKMLTAIDGKNQKPSLLKHNDHSFSDYRENNTTSQSQGQNFSQINSSLNRYLKLQKDASIEEPLPPKILIQPQTFKPLKPKLLVINTSATDLHGSKQLKNQKQIQPPASLNQSFGNLQNSSSYVESSHVFYPRLQQHKQRLFPVSIPQSHSQSMLQHPIDPIINSSRIASSVINTSTIQQQEEDITDQSTFLQSDMMLQKKNAEYQKFLLKIKSTMKAAPGTTFGLYQWTKAAQSQVVGVKYESQQQQSASGSQMSNKYQVALRKKQACPQQQIALKPLICQLRGSKSSTIIEQKSTIQQQPKAVTPSIPLLNQPQYDSNMPEIVITSGRQSQQQKQQYQFRKNAGTGVNSSMQRQPLNKPQVSEWQYTSYNQDLQAVSETHVNPQRAKFFRRQQHLNKARQQLEQGIFSKQLLSARSTKLILANNENVSVNNGTGSKLPDIQMNEVKQNVEFSNSMIHYYKTGMQQEQQQKVFQSIKTTQPGSRRYKVIL